MTATAPAPGKTEISCSACGWVAQTSEYYLRPVWTRHAAACEPDAQMQRTIPLPLCQCGCGQHVKRPTARFITAHSRAFAGGKVPLRPEQLNAPMTSRCAWCDTAFHGRTEDVLAQAADHRDACERKPTDLGPTREQKIASLRRVKRSGNALKRLHVNATTACKLEELIRRGRFEGQTYAEIVGSLNASGLRNSHGDEFTTSWLAGALSALRLTEGTRALAA